jgi:hypothetical protein
MNHRRTLYYYGVISALSVFLVGISLFNSDVYTVNTTDIFTIQASVGDTDIPIGSKLHARATVTGASSNHFETLLVFLQNYREKCQHIPLFTYDLGLTDVQTSILRIDYPWTMVRTFNFSQFPSHFNIDVASGEYAWKPIIVKEMLDTTTSAVLWLDSGDRLTKTSTLNDAFLLIARDGHLTTTSAGTSQMWIHPSTLAFLHASTHLDIMMCNGAIVGFDMRAYEKVVRPWAECAMKKICIAPHAATRLNHRQDQAVLTVLLYQAGRHFGLNSSMMLFDLIWEELLRSFHSHGGLGIQCQKDSARPLRTMNL